MDMQALDRQALNLLARPIEVVKATSLIGKRYAARYLSYRNEGQEFYTGHILHQTMQDLEVLIPDAAKRAKELQALMPRATITVAIEQQWKERHPVARDRSITRYETVIVSPDGTTSELQRSSFSV